MLSTKSPIQDWFSQVSSAPVPAPMTPAPRSMPKQDAGHMYTMPDGSKVPWIPFVNPYRTLPPGSAHFNQADDSPFFNTMLARNK